MEAFNNYLRQFPHYTPQVFEHVRPFLSAITIAPSDYLLRHGKTSRSIAFIEEGLMRLYNLNDGKEITNCFCKENTIVASYSSLISQKPSDLAIHAIEETKLISMSYDSLMMLYQKDLFWQQVGRLAAATL